MTQPQLCVNEIFHSIQGEGTRAGERCVLVRLTGCDLRCPYCDTQYAFDEGSRMTLDDIMAAVRGYGCKLVEVTGGEPLLQPAVHELLKRLADEGNTVLLETSGTRPIGDVDPRVARILDVKCPSSGAAERNHWENVDFLTPRDEVKFVILNRADYDWAKDVIARRGLLSRCPVLVSPVYGVLPPHQLAGWVLEDRLDVRVGLQLHKLIWPPTTRGV